MSSIKVTVLMPAYNTEKYIKDAIDSILNQTFGSFEFLIVNDGSTDGTKAIIESYNDPRIVLIDQPNSGVATALNTGLKAARGEYIARFDSDDISYPERLREQYDFITANREYVLTGSDTNYMDEAGNFIFLFTNEAHSDEEIRRGITSYCPFIHSTVMYRRDIALELGGYDPMAHNFEDHLLWTKFIQKGKVCNTSKILASIRFNPGSVTADEKLRGKTFIALKKEIIQQGSLTPEQEKKLLGILQSQNLTSFKKYSYYVLVAKKYLWNNHQPIMAREHLIKAIKLNPTEIQQYILLIMSYLPKKIISRIYKIKKNLAVS